MPSTHEEKLAHRRIVDKARRERIAEERAERLVLLHENEKLKKRVLELERDNAEMKNRLEEHNRQIDGITARDYRQFLKTVKRYGNHQFKVESVDKNKDLEKKNKPYFRFIDRAQTKRLFNIPHTEHLDDKGFTERAQMILSMCGWLGYEWKDYNEDVSPMLRDKKVSLKGLGKLFDIYKNQKQVFENIMEVIDKHDYPYAEINHPSLNDDFTI